MPCVQRAEALRDQHIYRFPQDFPSRVAKHLLREDIEGDNLPTPIDEKARIRHPTKRLAKHRRRRARDADHLCTMLNDIHTDAPSHLSREGVSVYEV